MKPITVYLERCAPKNGWANRLLRVDLSEMRIWAQETAPIDEEEPRTPAGDAVDA